MACYWYDPKTDTLKLSLFANEPRMPRRKRPRCGAMTRKGTPCQAPPVWDKARDKPVNGRCKLHGGLSTGPKTEEGRQRMAQAVSERMKCYWAERKACSRTGKEQAPITSREG